MKKYIICVWFLLLFVNVCQDIQAVPAYPYPVEIRQPDGSLLTVRLRGDEYHHFVETEDGHLITKDLKGFFNYATLDSEGKPIDTKIKANNKSNRSYSEKSFVSRLQSPASNVALNQQMRAKRPQLSEISSQNRVYPRSGSPRSLIILINFADLTFVTPNPQQAFKAMLNERGYSANGGTGSARDYFLDNSMGKFSPDFDVVGPYTLPRGYAYYGKNDKSGMDSIPFQMIADACTAAHQAGISFSVYDADNDDIVDNVFVYFAGHNEAEWAGNNTVWPHRWGIYPTSIFGNRDGNYTGTVESVTFDGKRVEDYACTSELRGRTGTSMAGIGTFTHEFGHVIGLADMYATNGASHHTLSDWNIMDGGAYLNNGRTPPAYNSFERFKLGYLTPSLLNRPRNAILRPLTSDNEAYLVSQTNNHNLLGDNPNPKEFFLFENRQKTGWDKYLPGHGMLIYRINYNQNDWDYNQPNNDPDKMAVDLMEADKIANDNTLAGDPLPGTSQISEYNLETLDGTILETPLTDIAENFDGIISFYYGTLPENELRYSVLDNNGNILVFLGAEELEDVFVYDTAGRLVKKIKATSTIIEIEGLHKKTVYIIKSGNRFAKIAII